MKTNTLSIGILTVTAAILFIAQFIPLRSAQAAETLKDRDYSLVSARSVRGGDTIYILNNRTGQMAIFVWNAGRRMLELTGIYPMTEAFQ